ncbi:serine hydrolase [Catalinimonas alkaloidigena]|uniref:serine hydrolase n=1 Tax=Catalinimonas alkaloidigena TaxID=1075417 RepID=UPI001FE116A1|nr:serine hydrolase [Catalinimonas alkaloidigena]
MGLSACSSSYHAASGADTPGNDLLIRLLRNRHSPVLERVLRQPEHFEYQILYTQIDRDAANRPTFRSYRLNVDSTRYFYPASTAKLPTALLALEKLNQLAIPGLDKYSTMLTDSGAVGQTAVYEDTTSATGLPSVAHYVRKILLVSDNDAYNRLYEFIGQEPLNERLHAKGYTDTRIFHRLEVARTPEQSRQTNPVRFYDADEQLLYEQPLVTSQRVYEAPAPILKGKGEMIEGHVVMEPKDFSGLNFYPLEEQQRLLRALLFPESVPEQARFQLTDDDYRFVYQAMSEFPRESRYPKYENPPYHDSYVKFLQFGDRKTPLDGQIRVFNKVGDAYGFLIDNAYVVDFENNLEFLLSAVVLVNENGIFNDGDYAYDTIGFPFLGELGRTLYDYERTRPRAHTPDLSRFRISYE